MGVRRGFAWAAVLLLVLLAAGVHLWAGPARGATRMAMIAQARDTVARGMSQLFQSEQALARLIIGTASVTDMSPDLAQRLQALPHEHPFVWSVIIVDGTEHVVVEARRGTGAPSSLASGRRLSAVGEATWPGSLPALLTHAVLVRSSEAGQNCPLVGVEQDLLDAGGQLRYRVYILSAGPDLPSAGPSIGRTWLIGDDGALLALPDSASGANEIATLSHSWRQLRSEQGAVGSVRQPMEDGVHLLLYRHLDGWPAAVLIDAGLAASALLAPHNAAALAILIVAAGLMVGLLLQSGRPDQPGRPLPKVLATSDSAEAIARRLAAGLAHEINNVLTVLSFDAEMLAVGRADDRDLVTLSRSMLGATEHATVLTRSLLFYSERAVLRPRILDMVAHLEWNEQRLSGVLARSQSLVFDFSSEMLLPVLVRLDPDALNGCLEALLRNAAEAMGPAGRIRLVLRLRGDAESSSGEMVVLSVIDSGGGMDAQGVERALEPGFSGKAQGRHAGLGLSAASGFARQSGGRITVSSRLGQGTEVSLSIPRIVLKDGVPSGASRAARGLVPGGDAIGSKVAGRWAARILVVDDSDQVRGSIVRRLRADGYVVLEARNAAEAEAHVTAGADVMVTDIVLDDDIDGFALAARARGIDASLPLVFMSGFVSARQPELLAGDEFASFVRKPLNAAELHAVIAGLLALRESRRLAAARDWRMTLRPAD